MHHTSTAASSDTQSQGGSLDPSIDSCYGQPTYDVSFAGYLVIAEGETEPEIPETAEVFLIHTDDESDEGPPPLEESDPSENEFRFPGNDPPDSDSTSSSEVETSYQNELLREWANEYCTTNGSGTRIIV